MDPDTPIACSLNAQGYRLRLEAVRELGAAGLLEAHDRPDGAKLTFRNTTRVRKELAAMVEAEDACCPFLALSVGAGEDELSLTITAPRDALPIVRDLVTSFQGATAR
jgi:hypothetical protein